MMLCYVIFHRLFSSVVSPYLYLLRDPFVLIIESSESMRDNGGDFHRICVVAKDHLLAKALLDANQGAPKRIAGNGKDLNSRRKHNHCTDSIATVGN
jgi:hypothetical protein